MVLNGGRIEGGGRVLSRSALQEMLTPQNQSSPLNLSQIGLGWHFRPSSLGREVWHDGSTTFFHSMLSVLPEQGLGLALMANSAEAADLTNTTYARILALVCGVDTLEPGENDLPGTDNGDPRGDYASVLGLASVEGEPQNLQLRLRPEVLLNLTRNAAGTYDVAGVPGLVVSFPTLDGERVLALRKDRTSLVAGAPVRPVELSPAWVAREGSYDVVNQRPGDFDLFTHITVRKSGPYLMLDIGELGSPSQFALAPLSETEAITMGLGPGMGETVRVLETGSSSPHLAYQGLVFRKKPDSL